MCPNCCGIPFAAVPCARRILSRILDRILDRILGPILGPILVEKGLGRHPLLPAPPRRDSRPSRGKTAQV